jgi:hypothetical protein
MLHRESKKQITLIPTRRHPFVHQVRLNLPTGPKFIGRLDEAGEGTFYTSRSQRHILRISNSIGLNKALLEDDSIFFNWIVIDLEGRKLYASREYFRSKGRTYRFANESLEPQVFMPIDELTMKAVREFEKEQQEKKKLERVFDRSNYERVYSF